MERSTACWTCAVVAAGIAAGSAARAGRARQSARSTKASEDVRVMARFPDEFFDLVAHHLPPEPPRVGPRGGRPWIGHRAVVRVIWFVLATGCRWEDVPPELGCSGRTARRRLRAWEECGCWDRLHAD